jgi:N-acyl-D-aspartate/D-glutamate deacylase
MDLLIKGGLVVDGSGSEPTRADVAIDTGRIVAVGTQLGSAKRTVDASGCMVTPGFVDIHTHYDGQATWDSELRPSSIHGVTTAVMGSCGVGFAPARPVDRERIIALMEGVEDIPGAALAEGIDWRWGSFAEYMDALDALPHAIDFACHVPHDALRVYAMGVRAAVGSAPSDADLACMQAELRAALKAGAVGFSTGRTDNHRATDGSETPAADAGRRELDALAQVFKELDHGVIQVVSDFDMAIGSQAFDPEFDLIEAMSTASGGRGVSISMLERIGDIEQWRRILSRTECAARAGHLMRVQTAPRGVGVLLGLEATFHPFIGFPSYKAVSHLPLAERVRHLRQPDVRTRLLRETSEPVAGDGSPIPPLADQLLARLDFVAMSLFRLGSKPNYEPDRQDSIYGQALREGKSPLEVTYDALLEDDGHALLYFPIYNYAAGNLDVVADMLHHPLALFGLSDGGAHVGTICDASFPTFLLTHWVRDRRERRLPLARAVQMLTSANAAWMGFRDRGTIAVGKRADINVINLDELELLRPRLAHDLPAGGKRFLQEARGYRGTLVNGELVAENGVLTGARPGRLVRGGS